MTGYINSQLLIEELNDHALSEPYHNCYDRNATEVIIKELTVSCNTCAYEDQSGFLPPCRDCSVCKKCYYKPKT